MSKIDKELEQIIADCQGNRRKGQELLHKKYYSLFMSISLRYTKNYDQAEDILQLGFIKIFKNINKYKGEGSFEGWMKRILVNTAIDFHRKKKNDLVLMPEEDGIEKLGIIEDEDVELDNYPYTPKQVIAAIQELSPAYQTVFNLYVIENYPHKEIAEILSISIGTSKSNLLKAKARLRKILLENFKPHPH
jgi:RNA polymerase sigma factor (sigma-70 family)